MAQICPCANSSFIYLFGDDIDIEEVHKTHESGNAFSDYEEIVRIITDILKPAFVVYRKVVEVKGPENKVPESSKDPLKLELLQIIQEIYWKMLCTCYCEGKPRLGVDGDEKECIKYMFGLVKKYPYDAKLLLVLAAFAMLYREYLWSTQDDTAQVDSYRNLKQRIFCKGKLSEDEKEHLKSLNSLVTKMLHLTKPIISLTSYTNIEYQSLYVRIVAYHMIRAVVVCFSSTMKLIKVNYRYTTSSEEMKLKTKQLLKRLDELKHAEKFLNDLKEQADCSNFAMDCFVKPSHTDVVDLIKKLFTKPTEGAGLKRDGKDVLKFEVFKGKSVGLFISDLDYYQENISEKFKALTTVYKEYNKMLFEVIWFPIVEEGQKEDPDPKADKNQMPWFWCKPSTIKRPFKCYIKECWNYQKKPILVVLDKEGKIISPNALPMIEIWGTRAHPFSKDKEVELWRNEEDRWNKEKWALIFNRLDTKILSMGKTLCLLGGSDVQWLRSFVIQIKDIKEKLNQMDIAIVYMGTNLLDEQKLQSIVSTITKDNEQHFFQPLEEKKGNESVTWPKTIIDFWRYLENYQYLRMENCEKPFHDDEILKELMPMSSFNAIADRWAIIFQGSAEVKEFFKFNGEEWSKCSEKLDMKISSGKPKTPTEDKFWKVLQAAQQEHCFRLVVPQTTAHYSRMVLKCLKCDRSMEKTFLYTCCAKESSQSTI